MAKNYFIGLILAISFLVTAPMQADMIPSGIVPQDLEKVFTINIQEAIGGNEPIGGYVFTSDNQQVHDGWFGGMWRGMQGHPVAGPENSAVVFRLDLTGIEGIVGFSLEAVKPIVSPNFFPNEPYATADSIWVYNGTGGAFQSVGTIDGTNDSFFAYFGFEEYLNDNWGYLNRQYYYFVLPGFSSDVRNDWASGEDQSYTLTFYRRVGEEAVVPEPATLAVLGLGLAGLGLARARRKK